MKLETYRKNNKLNYAQLGKFLEISKSVVYNICNENGKCISLPNAHKIVKATQGEVDYADLLWGDC